jgi:hypothetical protein
MSEILCAAPLYRQTEFALVPGVGRVMGACGLQALAACATSVLDKTFSTAQVYQLARANGWCDASGAMTIGGVQSTGIKLGLKVAAFRQYAEPWTDWEPWALTQITHGNPFVLEFANGQALVDVISGQGENAVNLQYHFTGFLGRNTGGASKLTTKILPPGWWDADGDNFAGGNNNANNFNAANVLQFYPDAVAAAARPCAGVAFVGRSLAMAWSTETDGSGKDAEGHVCTPGFLAAMKANGDLGVDGLSNSVALPNNTAFLGLSNGTLFVADPPSAEFKRFAGAGLAQEWMKLYGLYEAAQKAASTPPAPAPVSPEVQAALNLVAAIKAI